MPPTISTMPIQKCAESPANRRSTPRRCGSLRRPWVDAAQIVAGEAVPVMEGKQVFKLAVTRMPEATPEVLKAAGDGSRRPRPPGDAPGQPAALVALAVLGAGLHWGAVLMRD